MPNTQKVPNSSLGLSMVGLQPFRRAAYQRRSKRVALSPSCLGLFCVWLCAAMSSVQRTKAHRSKEMWNTTPVGFEPTRGDPIGLAGRRLNRSAKVSDSSSTAPRLAWRLASAIHAVAALNLAVMLMPMRCAPMFASRAEARRNDAFPGRWAGASQR